MTTQELSFSLFRELTVPCRSPLVRGFILLAFFRMMFWCGLSFGAVAAPNPPHISGSKVVYITDETFPKYKEGFLLVLYYADWSGQSRRLFPLWSKLAEELDSAGSSVTISLIDSQEYRQNPGSRYVHTLPTILLFHDGEILAQFAKGSTLVDLKSFVEEFSGLGIEELGRIKNLVIHQLEKTKLQQKKKVEEPDGQEIVVAGDFELDVPTLTRESFHPETYSKDTLVLVYTKWCEHCKAFSADWLALARDPQVEGLLVAKIDADSFTTFPGARLVKGVPTILFVRKSIVLGNYRGPWQLENVRIWVKNMTRLSPGEVQHALEDMHAQELQIQSNIGMSLIDMKNQPSAVNEEFNAIKELRNDNFVEETRGKSALILFYTDSGQRSQLMKPVWVALSKQQDLGGLLLARFPEQDTRWNQEMEYIHGYPTVLVARNGVIIERYEGVHKLDQLHHYAQSLLELSDEEAYSKGVHLVGVMQREKMAEADNLRLHVKAEEKRREEEVRKAKQLKRKQKSGRVVQ